MAKIISPNWSIIRGSIAGITYLTTPTGQIIARQRTRPTQPVSPWRTAIKNALTEAAADWSFLTATQQILWQAWATAHTGRSGRHEMMAGKTLLRYCAELPLPSAPVIVAWDQAPEFAVAPTMTVTAVAPGTPGTGIGVTVHNTSIYALYVFVEYSSPFGHSRSFWKGPWVPGAQDGSAIAAGASKTFNRFDGLAGDRIFARVRAVSNDNAAHQHGHVVTAASITYGTVAVTP
jgi:hypothetical protein